MTKIDENSASLQVKADRRARDLLGVSKDASAEQIKRAWRKLCLETHPDRNPGDPAARERFRRAHCAYRCLTERIACEELAEEPNKPSPEPAGGKYNVRNAWGYYLWWRDAFPF
jgi:preprotein translocase subunit Sec63